MNRILFTSIIVVFSALSLFPAEPVPLEKALSAITEQIIEKKIPDRAPRFAVSPFIAADADAKTANGLGTYLADRVTGGLSAKKIRIFEREQLARVMGELSLSQSGAINTDDAVKIGSLAPVDALVAGTYAVLGDRMELSIRVIHVVTGEILYTANVSVAMDDTIRGFIRPDKTVPDTDDQCELRYKRINAMLKDISTDGKVDSVVDESIKWPLFGDCTRDHSLILHTFFRYDKRPDAYHAYLVSEIRKAVIIQSSQVYLLADVIDYLAIDGVIDDGEWKALVSVFPKVAWTGYYNVVFGHALFPGRKDPSDIRLLTKRIDELMALVIQGKMGLPSPVNYDSGFYEIYGAVSRYGAMSSYMFGKYWPRVSSDNKPAIFESLKRTLNEAKGPAAKSEALDTLIAYFNAIVITDKTAPQIYHFLVNIDREDEKAAAVFSERCRGQLVKAFAMIRYNRDDRAELCAKYGIECPGLVKSVRELADDLIGGDTIGKKREAAKLLRAMGPRAKAAEKSVIAVLRHIESGSIDGYGSPNLHEECLDILGNLKPSTHEAYERLQTGLAHNYSNVSDAAARAFKKAGRAGIPYILNVVRRKEKHAKMNALKLLGEMGEAAKSAIPDLSKIRAAETDPYYRDIIDVTLRKIGSAG